MQHLDLRIGGVRYLLSEPQVTPGGRPTGYGNLVRHVEQTIRAGASLGATVFLIRPTRPINPALYEIDSPDVHIVGQSGWRALFLRWLWRFSIPVRYGKPVAWLTSAAASRVRAPIERAKHWSRRRGFAALGRWFDRLGHRCRRASNAYERHVVAAWRALFVEARERARATQSKKRRVRVRLRADIQRETETRAADIGLDPSRPIVTLHVREGGYRTRGAERQRDFDAIREAKLDTYEPGVTWLTTRGYQVVRIGDPSMTPCRWPGVVDLATAPSRTGALELWTLLHSRFFIASDSGPYFLSKLCGVPALSVNVVQLGYYIAGRRDRYICKQVYDRTLDRRLSIAERLTHAFLETALDRTRYEWVDNEPTDILEAIEDMIASLAHPKMERTPAQRRHDELLVRVSAERTGPARKKGSLLFRTLGPGTISPRFAARYLDSAGGLRLEPAIRMR